MAQWLKLETQLHETHCHDMEVMCLNPNWIEIGMRNTSV